MPKAPKLLGSLVGLAVAEGAVPAGKLVDVYEKVEDTETRRRGVAEALLYVKVCVWSMRACSKCYTVRFMVLGLNMLGKPATLTACFACAVESAAKGLLS